MRASSRGISANTLKLAAVALLRWPARLLIGFHASSYAICCERNECQCRPTLPSVQTGSPRFDQRNRDEDKICEHYRQAGLCACPDPSLGWSAFSGQLAGAVIATTQSITPRPLGWPGRPALPISCRVALKAEPSSLVRQKTAKATPRAARCWLLDK